MMKRKALVIQTAFIGDVVLVLPLIQELKRLSPETEIDVVAVPRAANVLANHPDIHKVMVFDKRRADKGISGLMKLALKLRRNNYELALVPHRSLRSAALALLAQIPQRIGFNTSAGRWMFTQCVLYQSDKHEVTRNIELLKPLGISAEPRALPRVYPSSADKAVVDALLHEEQNEPRKRIAVAPGTVWKTKQWLPERFLALSKRLIERGYVVVLIGGKEDEELADAITKDIASPFVLSSIGKLTLLQSAELMRRCDVLVANDSAPLHLAVAVGTPVVAIFGATIPGFGFAPIGKRDVVVETQELTCRPCSIHGGKECPITTFDCMTNITVEHVLEQVEYLSRNDKGL